MPKTPIIENTDLAEGAGAISIPEPDNLQEDLEVKPDVKAAMTQVAVVLHCMKPLSVAFIKYIMRLDLQKLKKLATALHLPLKDDKKDRLFYRKKLEGALNAKFMVDHLGPEELEMSSIDGMQQNSRHKRGSAIKAKNKLHNVLQSYTDLLIGLKRDSTLAAKKAEEMTDKQKHLSDIDVRRSLEKIILLSNVLNNVSEKQLSSFHIVSEKISEAKATEDVRQFTTLKGKAFKEIQSIRSILVLLLDALNTLDRIESSLEKGVQLDDGRLTSQAKQTIRKNILAFADSFTEEIIKQITNILLIEKVGYIGDIARMPKLKLIIDNFIETLNKDPDHNETILSRLDGDCLGELLIKQSQEKDHALINNAFRFIYTLYNVVTDHEFLLKILMSVPIDDYSPKDPAEQTLEALRSLDRALERNIICQVERPPLTPCEHDENSPESSLTNSQAAGVTKEEKKENVILGSINK